MTLPPVTAEAIRQALSDVAYRARVSEQCPDTEATMKALRDVSWAVIRAAELIRTAERASREAATQRTAA